MTEYKKGSDVNIIKESAIRYGIERYKGYTIEDYYALPEDTRAELIDGVLYDMASPSVRHQDIAMQVSFQMVAYVNKKGGKCKVLQGRWMYSLIVMIRQWWSRISSLYAIRRR